MLLVRTGGAHSGSAKLGDQHLHVPATFADDGLVVGLEKLGQPDVLDVQVSDFSASDAPEQLLGDAAIEPQQFRLDDGSSGCVPSMAFGSPNFKGKVARPSARPVQTFLPCKAANYFFELKFHRKILDGIGINIYTWHGP